MRVRDYTGHDDHATAIPVWAKTGAVFDAAQASLPSIYWPWLVHAGTVHTLPTAGQWRMYYSTDHGAGGIAVATAPGPAGPWTDQGPVYNDTTAGFSTETPSVVWDPDAGLWRMWYQQAGVGSGAQSTLLATSPDGLAWTRQGVAITVAPGAWPGDGHTGYAVPHRIAGRWVAYHLLGGGNWPRFGISYSTTGANGTWWTDPRPLGYAYDQATTVVPGYRVEWNHGHVVSYAGRMWWVGILSSFGSGGGPVQRVLAQAPLAADLRHLLGRPRLLFPGDAPANVRALHVAHHAGRLVLTYQVDQVFHQAVTL